MNKQKRIVRTATADEINAGDYVRRCVGAVILTHDNKILLQQRDGAKSFPFNLSTFGGGIDAGETPMRALVRELNEELGARVNPADVLVLDSIIENESNRLTLIHTYFWHDKQDTITGCYEGYAAYYDVAQAALSHPQLSPDLEYLLHLCRQRCLIK